ILPRGYVIITRRQTFELECATLIGKTRTDSSRQGGIQRLGPQSYHHGPERFTFVVLDGSSDASALGREHQLQAPTGAGGGVDEGMGNVLSAEASRFQIGSLWQEGYI